MNFLLTFFGGISGQIYIYIALILSSFGAGFYVEHLRFANFENKVVVAAKTQETENKAKEKQSQLINEGIKNEYEAKLAAVRNYYSIGVRHTSSGSMSSLSAAPKGTDAETAYTILAGQCAETTTQAVELQKWINEQIGIK
jgi:hypothetical protein